jgi:WS/DGAT/MGAT family acyltransferase
MQQLTGLDASFIYAETARSPMHIAPLLIYDVSTAPNGFVRFKDILRTFEERLDRSPIFRRRLASVPLNLDHPYWVDDDHFDLEFHVRHIALPKPGDWRQLCIQIARLHARPLDRSRPLWEAYVIEGLDNVAGLPEGCFALFIKIHHACIDGVSGVQIVNAIHDLTPEPPPAAAKRKARPTEAAPGNLELLWNAYRANLRSPQKIARLIGEGIPAWQRVRTGEKEHRFHSLGEKERTRFNAAISPNRVFGAAVYDLEEIRAIKAAVEGATVNDVILAIVGGALREYLASKGELPAKSLVAGAPVNVRDDAETDSGGNLVSMMSISLCSDIADHLKRLQAVHGEALDSKAYHNAVGARLMTDVASNLPSQVAALGLRAAASTGLMAGMKPVFNTVVTNVPGPQVPLYMGGAKLVKSLGAGPCTDGLGLFHPVTSYNGEIAISFQACRELMPDPDFYEQCLRDTFEEMRDQVLGARAAKRGRRAKAAAGAKRKAGARTKKKAAAKAKAGGGTQTRAKTKAKAATSAKTKSRTKSTAEAATRARPKATGAGKSTTKRKAAARPKSAPKRAARSAPANKRSKASGGKAA